MDKADKKFAFKTLNSEANAILAELDELVALRGKLRDSEQIDKNNEAFLQLLDRLNTLEPVIQAIIG